MPRMMYRRMMDASESLDASKVSVRDKYWERLYTTIEVGRDRWMD